MADSGEPSVNADALSDAYERLRATVLADAAGGWRLGRGVLSARGVAAWIGAVGEVAAPAGATTGAATGAGAPATTGRERPAGPAVALPQADQVVAVLTQMVLPLAA